MLLYVPVMGTAALRHTLERLLLAVVGLSLLLSFARTIKSPVGLDEGYNLEVVYNLAQGVGYASFGNHRMDAWWSAGATLANTPTDQPLARQIPEPWFFDPRVTTGPTVLMPLGLLFSVFAGNLTVVRVFMWTFVPLFFFALWWALPEGTRRWPAVALAGSLVVSLWYGFRPGAVLGELPAATLFAAACVALVRSRPFLGGLLFGFAALAKIIVLPGSLLVIGVVGVSYLLGKGNQKQPLLLLAAGLALPLAAFELYRLFSLGSLDGWLASWQEFLAFSKEQTSPPTPSLWAAKWRSLKTLGPGLLFALAALAAIVGLTLTSRKTTTSAERRPLLSQNPGALMVIGAAPIFLLWFFRSAQTSYRQAVPAALLLFAGLTLWWLTNTRPELLVSPGFKLPAACYFIAVALSVMAVAAWAVRFWRASDLAERFEEQKRAAALLKTSGAQSISSAVRFYEPFPFLTNLRVNPCPGPNQALIVTAWAQVAEGKDRDFYRSRCAVTIFENRDALICWPKAAPFSLKDLKVSDWGPKQLTYARNRENRRPTSTALWFRLERRVLHRPHLVLLVSDQPSGLVTWAADGTWFSAPFAPTLIPGPGIVDVSLWSPCAGEQKHLGQIVVQK